MAGTENYLVLRKERGKGRERGREREREREKVKRRLASISVGRGLRQISRGRPSARISNFSFHATEWDSSLFLRAPARASGPPNRFALCRTRKVLANTDKSFFLPLDE